MNIPTHQAAAFMGVVLLSLTTSCSFAGPKTGGTAGASSDLATVRRTTFQPHYSAYGQIKPIHDITVRSQLQGIVEKLAVVPGESIKQGQMIAQITGPSYQAAIRQAQAAVVHAQAQLKLATQLVQGIDQLPKGLRTRPKMQKAAAAVTEAHSDLNSAKAQRVKLRSAAQIKAPAAGIAVAVQAANGERVAAGDRLIKMQPAGKLWLKADYYGSDIAKLHPGMKGLFHPASGSPTIVVTLLHVVPPQKADGAVEVVCLPANHPPAGWRNGAAGRLELLGKTLAAIRVPTSSLVMDQAHWWVLVHDAKGDHPQAVTPGPSAGESTLITSGLKPGEQVVVHDAYLRYHRNFAKQYTPPD